VASTTRTCTISYEARDGGHRDDDSKFVAMAIVEDLGDDDFNFDSDIVNMTTTEIKVYDSFIILDN